MRIRVPLQLRWKLLLAMLIIGIVPLVVSAWFDIQRISELGTTLAEQSGRSLSEQTRHNLENLADNYARVIDRERQLVELLTRIQAARAERALNAALVPAGEIHWTEEFDQGSAPLDLEFLPQKYSRPSADGATQTLPVSFTHQSFYTHPNISRAELLLSARRLVQLTPLYAEAHRHHGDIVHRQYTVLENGLIGVYPGHGGSPPNFEPRERDWYLTQRAAPKFQWSRPHIDITSRQAFINATMPLFDSSGDFRGLTGIDVRLGDLLESLSLAPHLGKASQVLLTFVDHADEDDSKVLIVAGSRGDANAKDWRELSPLQALTLAESDAQQQLRADIRAGRAGTLRAHFQDEDVVCVYRPLGYDGAALVFFVPAAEIVNPAVDAAEYAMASANRQVDLLIPLALAFVLAVAIIALVSSKTITDPIHHLMEATNKVAAGDFDVRVSIKTGDELEHLGTAFNNMVPQLKEHTRVRRSLRMASEVQRHLLPQSYPNIPGIELGGRSKYCEQTGGDYFDFLDFSNDGARRIGVTLGDVSGHGIASALLMATVRALLHGYAHDGIAPAAVLQHINENLVDDVHAGHYMTLVYMLIDLDHNQLSWANAGHHPPIRYRPDVDDFSELDGQDIPLAIDGSWTYETTHSTTLARGDLILLGTDGIWETRNKSGEFFGKQRLQNIIRDQPHSDPDAICGEVLAALQRFRGGLPQLDDVSVTAFRITA